MATLTEIRQQYPQYSDIPDTDLADMLYNKFYTDIPREEFNSKLGLQEKSEGFLAQVGKGVDITQALGYGALEWAGEAVGSDTVAGVGKRGRERNLKQAGEVESQTFLGIRGVGDSAAWVHDTVGQQLPIMSIPITTNSTDTR